MGQPEGYPKPSRASSTKTRIETLSAKGEALAGRDIKSKFHENKDWNMPLISDQLPPGGHQEQVPRKQGLKLNVLIPCFSRFAHQEQVPRKQGLKPTSMGHSPFHLDIKSKFHENKDWNSIAGARSWEVSVSIKSKFHENKDWNELFLTWLWMPVWHQEQVPRKQGLKLTVRTGYMIGRDSSRASSTKTRIETTFKK